MFPCDLDESSLSIVKVKVITADGLYAINSSHVHGHDIYAPTKARGENDDGQLYNTFSYSIHLMAAMRSLFNN